MKINKILYKVAVIMMLLMVLGSPLSYAVNNSPHITEEDGSTGHGQSTSGNQYIEGDGSKGLPSLGDYRPTATLSGSALTIVTTILGVLQVLGVVAVVVGIALVGFNSILGSAAEKAQGQEKYVGIVIAALLIAGGSTIAKFLIGFAEGL